MAERPFNGVKHGESGVGIPQMKVDGRITATSFKMNLTVRSGTERTRYEAGHRLARNISQVETVEAQVLTQKNPKMMRSDILQLICKLGVTDSLYHLLDDIITSCNQVQVELRYVYRLLDSGQWRNGRRYRLKICCPVGRVSSNLTFPIMLIGYESVIPQLEHLTHQSGY